MLTGDNEDVHFEAITEMVTYSFSLSFNEKALVNYQRQGKCVSGNRYVTEPENNLLPFSFPLVLFLQ